MMCATLSLKSAWTLAAFLLIPPLLVAGEGSNIFELGEPQIGGNGCNDAIITTLDGNDGNSKISILFSDYEAETGFQVANGLSKNRVRKHCAMSVPIKVKQGFSVGIFKSDYRGYAEVPNKRGSYAQFSAEYFFAGQLGPKRTKAFQRDFADDFTITDEVAVVMYTPCDDTDQIFRINTSILSKKRSTTDEETYVVVETADLSIPVSCNYYFKVKRCGH